MEISIESPTRIKMIPETEHEGKPRGTVEDYYTLRPGQ